LQATVAHAEGFEYLVLAEVRRPLASPRLVAVVVGVPLLLLAFGLGLCTAVAAWLAPWAFAAAVPYVVGRDPGRVVTVGVALLALLVGPAPLAGALAGTAAAEVAGRGASVRLALGAAAAVAIGAVLAAALPGAPASAGATGSTVAKSAGLIPWVSFDRGRAESLAAACQLVFVDVTADWCFTCKVNERLILDTPEVARAFREHSVVPMRADWTNRNDEIGSFLAEHGRYGIPFYLLYLPGGDTRVFSELPSKTDLIDAVRRSAVPARVAALAGGES